MPGVSITSNRQQLEIEYEVHGRGSNPWIVLVRGLGTQMIEWSPVLIDGLVHAGLQVLMFDNRDVGKSSKMIDDYSADDMAADIAGLMDVLGIECAHIFGVSMGGIIAQIFAHDYPEKVLCLFSVMSSSGDPGLPKAKPAVWAWLTFSAENREDYIALDAESRVVFGSPAYPESEAQRIAMSTATYDRCFYPEGSARQMRAVVASGNRVEQLKAINVPTMVIHGADDVLLLPAHGEDTAKHIPNAKLLVLPGMGHNIPATLAPQIVELVADFISAEAR